MDWSDPRIWAGVVIVAQFFFWLLGQIYRPRFATVSQLDAETAARVAIGHEVALLKQRVDGLPTHDTITELREDVGDMKERLVENSTRLESMGDKMDMMRETLGVIDAAVRAK